MIKAKFFVEILEHLEAKDLAKLQQVSKNLKEKIESCNSQRSSQICINASDFGENFKNHMKYVAWVEKNLGITTKIYINLRDLN